MPRARINDIELHYDEWGRGFPVVAVPGFTETSSMWQMQRDAFAAHHRFIVYDARGHGASDAPDDADRYSPELLVDDIAALLDHLGEPRAHIMGHSLGGAIAMRFALAHPDRTARLVVVNSNSGSAPPEWQAMLRERLPEMARSLRAGGVASLAASMINYRLPPGLLAEREREFAALSPIGLAHTAERVLADVSSLARAHQIGCPTLLVAGERDREFPERSLWLAERIADCQRVVIANAGHGANEHEPELFNQIVLAFLAGDRTDAAP